MFSRDNFLTIVCQVIDIFGDSSGLSKDLKVNPIPVSALDDVIKNQMSVAFKNLDVDKVGSIVSAATSTLNSVNCSLTPACVKSFNRETCSTVANTCGRCLPGYVGIDGHANAVCAPGRVDTARRRRQKQTSRRQLLQSLTKDINSLIQYERSSYRNSPLLSSDWDYIDGSVCMFNSHCYSGKCFRGLCLIGN